MTKKLIKNAFKCLHCDDIIESKHRHDFSTCKCEKSCCDGDKIRCIDGSKQKTLELGKVYTVDTSMNTTDNRVYVKENKRFSFLKSRFELVEVLL